MNDGKKVNVTKYYNGWIRVKVHSYLFNFINKIRGKTSYCGSLFICP